MFDFYKIKKQKMFEGKRVAAVAAARTKTKQNSNHPKSVQIPAQPQNRHRTATINNNIILLHYYTLS